MGRDGKLNSRLCWCRICGVRLGLTLIWTLAAAGGGGLVRSDGDERADRQRCDEVCEVKQGVCEVGR